MILDIIAVIIIGYCLFIGAKKGLVNMLFKTLSFALALFLTAITLNAACDAVTDTELGKYIYEKTEITLIEEGEIEEKLGVLEFFIDTEELYGEVTGLQEKASVTLGDIIIRAGCAIALFIVYSILIKLAGKILNTVAELPIINVVNKLGGFLAGGVNAYIVMIMLTCILTFLMSTKFGEVLEAQLDSSLIASWFVKNNPLL